MTRALSRIFSGLPFGTPRSRHALHRFVTMHVFMHRTYNCIHITVTRRRSCAVYIHPMRGHLRRIAGALGQATRTDDDSGQPCMCARISWIVIYHTLPTGESRVCHNHIVHSSIPSTPTLYVHTGQDRRRITVLPKRGMSGTHGNASASRLTTEAVQQAEVQVHHSEVRECVHPHKRPCIALQPSVYICSIHIAVVTPLIAHHPIDSLHVYHTVIVISRGGDKRSADRTYAYIMHCFAWGTATPCIPVHHLIA